MLRPEFRRGRALIEKQPSRTALAAAAHRAAHQVLEQGGIFADPLAVPILGADAGAATEMARAHPETRGMRLFIAMRSSVAESALRAGVEDRGVRQLVVLGAGLDTFGYRNPFADRLKVFEVDHPATQAWKRRRLSDARVALPPSLVFTPMDFEREGLLDRLTDAGFDPAQRTFFTWLGVVPYLTKPAISATLAIVAGLAGGAEVVFDYSDPPASLDPEAHASHQARAARVAALGEPFLSYFEPASLHAELAGLRFDHIEDLGPQGLLARYFPSAPPGSRPDRGGHVLFASTRSATVRWRS
jgi:methyltransferase (TIGR00027 family)